MSPISRPRPFSSALTSTVLDTVRAGGELAIADLGKFGSGGDVQPKPAATPRPAKPSDPGQARGQVLPGQAPEGRRRWLSDNPMRNRREAVCRAWWPGTDEQPRKTWTSFCDRINEIEQKVAMGEMDAFQCFTQMRQMVDAARSQSGCCPSTAK